MKKIEELKKLKDLLDNKFISQEEFNSLKNEVLENDKPNDEFNKKENTTTPRTSSTTLEHYKKKSISLNNKKNQKPVFEDNKQKCDKCSSEIFKNTNVNNKGLCRKCKGKKVLIPKWIYLFLLLLVPLSWWLLKDGSKPNSNINTAETINIKTENIEIKSKYLHVNGFNIWVRNKASTGDVVMKLNDNPKVKVLDSCCFETIKNDSSYWYKIEHKNQQGWMFGTQTREHLMKKTKKTLSTEPKALYQKIKKDPSIVKFHGFGINKGSWDIYLTNNEVLYVNDDIQSSPISFTLLDTFNPNKDKQSLGIINYRNSYESYERLIITKKISKVSSETYTHSIHLQFDSGMYDGKGKTEYEIVNDNTSFEKVSGFTTRAKIKNPKIGDFHEGGIVFWIDPDDNSKGLVCAIADNTSDKYVSWAPLGTTINYKGTKIGAFNSEIGGGLKNTNTIVSKYGASKRIAAGLAHSFKGGGYNDWYLPNKNEFKLIFEQKNIISNASIKRGGNAIIEGINMGVGNYSNIAYWTSNESSKHLGVLIYFNRSINTYTDSKSKFFRVRAVRAF